MAMIIMAATVGIGTLTLVSAIARRIAGPYGSRRLAAEALRARLGGGDGREVEALRDEVDQLRREVEDLKARSAELDDVQNRLDFAERLLAQSQARGALGAPKDA